LLIPIPAVARCTTSQVPWQSQQPTGQWPEALSRAQLAPTKGPSQLNQRLGLGTTPGPWPLGGLGRPVEPVVESPTHPVMPNLVVLWEMSPLRRGVRAGARLWARQCALRTGHCSW
jgi:hypothetical protein